MHKALLVAAALVKLEPIAALADSLPIANGRYSGGPVIELRLNQTQIKVIQKHYSPYMEMRLDKAQQETIRQSSKIRPAPTKLIVVYPNDAASDCTCGLANIGVIFRRDAVEVPVSYLATDKDAEEMKIID